MEFELTKSQKDAFSEINTFIDKKHPNSWFMLEGKAGVGKTTVLIDVIMKYNGKKRVVASAISHKAKNVLYEKCRDQLDKSKGKNTINFCSVASMLGMRFDETTGEFTYDKRSNDFKVRPVDTADIIIVDEASMIDEKILKLIMKEKKPTTKVIFSGDRGQLPPIRETDSDDHSPTFNTDYKYNLYERLRQGEESPILPYSDYYWNSVIENIDYVSIAPRGSLFTDKGNLHFADKLEAIDMCVPVFKKSISDKDPNLMKIVCFKNDTRRSINKYIRQSIFEEPDEFEIGDLLIMMDNYSLGDGDLIIENSQEFQVLGVDEDMHIVEGEEIKVYNIEVDYELGKDKYLILPVVAEESKDDFDRLVTYRFDEAKKQKMYTKERSLAFAKAYDLVHKYASLDYAYAITSHKAQGSTYKGVVVYERDIMEVLMTSQRTKYRSMYTAITRASNICIIMN